MPFATVKARDTGLLSGSPARQSCATKKTSVNCSEVIDVTKDVNYTSIRPVTAEGRVAFIGYTADRRGRKNIRTDNPGTV
jgi:hypothetical protein